MDKDYNIDDILNEVKKRQKTEHPKKQEKAEPIEKAEEITEQPQKEIPEPPIPEVQEEPVFAEIVEKKPEPEPEEKPLKTEKIPVMEKTEPDSEELVDLNVFNVHVDHSEKAEEETMEEAPKKPKKKTGLKVLAIVLVVLIALGIGGYFGVNHYINSKLDKVVEKDPEVSEWTGMDELVEKFEPIEETDASELASFKDMVKTWYSNGEPASSSHVLNIMLIGEDTRGDEILDDGTRADSAIICSINKDTKQITLTSILRDTYAYWENPYGDENSGVFDKINAAMSKGDVKVYCKTVEQLYKIKIDNYVIVNFSSFEKIIDTLGGVTLKLTSREINEINSHQKRYGHVTIEQEFEGTSGKQKLNGKQALAYCRIRKLDSDNKRADRQKTCLTQVYKEFKKASFSSVLKIVDDLLPYVKTNMPVKTIKKVARYALSDGWLDYEIENTTVPEARINEEGSGDIHWGTWCWKTDFPQDAYNLQMKIYGKSNITLARTRVDVINCAEEGFFKEGAPAVTATIMNEHYGEVTTLPAKEESEEEETSEEQ